MTAQQLAERLGPWRKAGARYLVHCPAHDDQHPSLALADGEKGLVLKCQAGCDQRRVMERVCERAGIAPRDLFYAPLNDTTPRHEPRPNGRPRIVATYDYHDANNAVLFQTVRYNPKDFRQRRPDGNGGWLWNLNGVQPVLYRLPEVKNAITAGRLICIAEGEKDAETLRSIGVVATCNPMGAQKWREDYTDALRGAHVIILPDNDVPGRAHAEQVAHALHGIAASVKVVTLPNLPAAGDVSDWVHAGGTKAQLKALVQATPAWAPLPQGTPGLPLTSLRDLLNEPEEATQWLVDGLLPESGFSLLVAKPKVGKSTLARNLALCVAAQGKTFFGRSVQHGPVIYLALEEKRSEVKKHFQEMGATGDEPIDISTTSAPADGLAQVRAIAEQRKPVLIIIDPLFRFTRVKDGNDYAQVTQALEPLLRLARETRAHVLCVHHSGKTHREDGDNILGSTAIFGSVDTLLTMKRYRQDADDYRTIASIQRYGDDLPETVLHYDKITRTTNLGASKQQEDVNRIQQAILAYLQTQEDDRESGIPPTEPQIAEDVEGKTVHKRKALRELVESRRILRLGRGGKGDPFRYALTDSRFAGSHVPHRYREPGNKNPKMDADQQKSSADSCSQTFQSSENTGNKNPTLETDLLYAPNVEKHVTEEVFE